MGGTGTKAVPDVYGVGDRRWTGWASRNEWGGMAGPWGLLRTDTRAACEDAEYVYMQ